MTKAKRNTLLFLLVFGLLVILVAISLPTLELAPGTPFSLAQPRSLPFGLSTPLPRGDLAILIIRGVLALALILLPFALLYALMTPDGRRRLLVYTLVIIVLFFVADYLRTHNAEAQPPEQTTIFGTQQNPQLGDSTPVSVFTPNPPPSLTVAIALAVSLLLVIVIIGVVRYMGRRPDSATPLERLAEEVQNAIESLNTGGDLKTTIIHCYQEMSRVVQEHKGITRHVTMTPREFKDQLVKIGLPAESIQTLTALFERVRYGNITAGAKEEALALDCLTNIAAACRSGGRVHDA